MNILFSALVFFTLIGVLAWWGIQEVSVEQGLGIENPAPDPSGVFAPIDDARAVKKLVEERDGGVLDLSDQGLTNVPAYVFDRTSVVTLDLSHNALTGALPAEIRKLKQIRMLDLSNNAFTGVPAEIGQLENLETLDLSHNPLTGLPYELSNLKNLKVLDLRGTQYSSQDLQHIREKLPSTTDIRTE